MAPVDVFWFSHKNWFIEHWLSGRVSRARISGVRAQVSNAWFASLSAAEALPYVHAFTQGHETVPRSDAPPGTLPPHVNPPLAQLPPALLPPPPPPLPPPPPPPPPPPVQPAHIGGGNNAQSGPAIGTGGGNAGAVGAAGAAGTAGTSGTTGATGTTGTTGTTGAAGNAAGNAAATSGTAGTAGAAGTTGTAGTAGTAAGTVTGTVAGTAAGTVTGPAAGTAGAAGAAGTVAGTSGTAGTAENAGAAGAAEAAEAAAGNAGATGATGAAGTRPAPTQPRQTIKPISRNDINETRQAAHQQWVDDDQDALEQSFEDWYENSVVREWQTLQGERWYGLNVLGQGGFGIVQLLVRKDQHGNTTHRMARKDMYVNLDSWMNRTRWIGKVPSEVALHYRLSQTGCEFVIPFYNWSINYDLRRITMYIGFAPHGDLFKLCDLKVPGTNQPRYGVKGTGQRRFPTPFLWYVAYALATTLMYMEYGSTTAGSVRNWKPIIHKDLKPDNILLGEEADLALLKDSSARFAFPFYPKPIVADLGISFETPIPFGSYNDYRVYNYPKDVFVHIPPELRIMSRGLHARLGRRVTSAANVWQVGAVLYALVTGKAPRAQATNPADGTVSERPLHFYGPQDVDRLLLQDKKYLPYGRAFLEMIRSCLRFAPADRPSVERLHGMIEGNILLNAMAPRHWRPEDLPNPLNNWRTLNFRHKLFMPDERYPIFKGQIKKRPASSDKNPGPSKRARHN